MNKQYDILSPIKWQGKVSKSGQIELPATIGDALAKSGTLRDLSALMTDSKGRKVPKPKPVKDENQTGTTSTPDAATPASGVDPINPSATAQPDVNSGNAGTATPVVDPATGPGEAAGHADSADTKSAGSAGSAKSKATKSKAKAKASA